MDEDRKRVKDYQGMLLSLKNIAATSTYEHLQYFAQSLSKDLKDEVKLHETLSILDEKDEETLDDEEKGRQREQKKQAFIAAFEREVERIHNYVEQTAKYYQTDGKVKFRIFLIYAGLAIVLGICSYLSISLLPPLE